jgi:outer membrane protein OmpA-like peptidoglycan-associated protein
MNHTRSFSVLIATLVAVLLAACGPHRVKTPPTRAGQDLIVLLPNPDDGVVGKAIVSNPAGAVNLSAARESTTVSPNQAPAPVSVLSEADVQRVFGEALSALPPAAQHFVLYFRFESDELTDQSRALVPEILRATKDRPVPDVAVVGHTDTTGTAAGNVELGLKRANAIRTLLINAGIDGEMIEVTSHGESDPLVKTADEVAEPRNRRVDITVR